MTASPAGHNCRSMRQFRDSTHEGNRMFLSRDASLSRAGRAAGRRAACDAVADRCAVTAEPPRAEERDGYYGYADAIPLLFTTLDRLQTSGPRDAVWWRCGHGQWEALPDALANPADQDAWYARDEQRRRQREEAEQRRQQEWAVERERWAQEPDPAPEPVPEVARCERCKGPITGPLGYDLEFAPPEDGRHCPSCRTDLRQQYPTLRQAVFGRRPRGK
ncbi:hypothetical protein [Streptomyces mirabilis]|uniref:hypothetical protein n=1 Tax=Streptomyces mirabilis TaxID=68239 RepID=UPI00340FAB66